VPGTVQSIDRAAAVLRLLAAAPEGLGVADLANALGLAKPTVHGILRTLHQVGFVDQDHSGAHYHLSDAFGRLGESYLDPNELRSRAINWADSLASRSGEVVRVGRLVEGKVVVVHHVFRPDDSDQDLDVGTTLPPHATALGKAVLAFDTSAASRPRKLEAFTTRTITDPSRLSEELAAVRSRGWATEFEEHTVELASIAAPIRGLGGLVVGAVGLAGRIERICDSRLRHRDDLVSMVRATADAIARDLRDDR
jgi:DNA-binding IclR family transcriptional regulator